MIGLSGSKKGSLGGDIFAIIVLISGLAITAVIAYLVFSSFLVGFQSTDAYTPDTMDSAIDGVMRAFNMLDYVIFLIAVSLIIGLAIVSWKVATRPIGFLLQFFLAAFYGFIAYIFNIFFVGFFSQDQLQSTLVHFHMTMILCTNFHWIALASLFFAVITLFGKKEKGQYV